MRLLSLTNIVTLLAIGFVSTTQAEDIYGLQEGTVELKSVGPLAFGPSGILFVSDPMAANIYAVQTGDSKGDASSAAYEIADLPASITKALHASDVKIVDLAVNPATGNLFLAMTSAGKPAVVMLKGDTISQLPLDKIAHAKTELSSVPEDKVTGQGRRRGNKRGESVTDLAFVDGELIVSGLNNEMKSSVRSLVFPFSKVDKGSSLEIYHAAHGRSEDTSAMRTFIPMVIDGEPNLLAGFVCTPLVKFPISQIGSAEEIKGTTVAELGNRNRPLDMIVYQQGDSHYILMANSARGVMKVSTDDIANNSGLTEPVRGGGVAGQSYETIAELEGTVQLDKLNETHAVVIIQQGDSLSLKTVSLP